MSLYSFKKDCIVYLVFANKRTYKLDVSDISFSQTLQEKSYSSNSIQSQNLFEKSKIYKANPANFKFNMYAIKEADLRIVFSRLLDCYSFELYIETKQDVFKLNNCIITEGKFTANRFAPLDLEIMGEATILKREGDTGSTEAIIPGILQERSAQKSYNKITTTTVFIDSGTEIETLTSISATIKNNIEWKNNLTIKGCEEETVTYPIDFYVKSKTFTGDFTSHFIDDFIIYKDSSLFIQIGETNSNGFFGFEFDLPNTLIVPKLETGEIFKHQYSWKLLDNPNSLHELLTYKTYEPGIGEAILDNFTGNNPILDSLGDALLGSV